MTRRVALVGLDSTARHARHDELDSLDTSYVSCRTVSRRDMTSLVEFGLIAVRNVSALLIAAHAHISAIPDLRISLLLLLLLLLIIIIIIIIINNINLLCVLLAAFFCVRYFSDDFPPV